MQCSLTKCVNRESLLSIVTLFGLTLEFSKLSYSSCLEFFAVIRSPLSGNRLVDRKVEDMLDMPTWSLVRPPRNPLCRGTWFTTRKFEIEYAYNEKY